MDGLKGGEDGPNEKRELIRLIVYVCEFVFHVRVYVYMFWHCADIVLTWRAATAAVLIWWLGNILEFVYLFIQL